MSTPQQIRDACFAAFPFRLSLEPENIQPLDSDPQHDTTAFQLAAAGHEPAVPLVLRRYQARLTRWHLFDELVATREFAVLSVLHDAGFPVPEPLTVTRRGNEPWSLTGRVTGQTMDDSPELEELTPVWATLLARLHRLGSSIIRDESSIPIRSIREIFGTYRSWAGRAEDEELMGAFARLAPLVEQLRGETQVLLHGDWQPANALVDYGQIVAVINWENSAIGDARWDLATALNWLGDNGMDGSIEGFMAAYAQAVGHEVQEMPTFRAITTLGEWALSSWLRAAHQRGDELPLPKPHLYINRYETFARRALEAVEAAEASPPASEEEDF